MSGPSGKQLSDLIKSRSSGLSLSAADFRTVGRGAMRQHRFGWGVMIPDLLQNVPQRSGTFLCRTTSLLLTYLAVKDIIN